MSYETRHLPSADDLLKKSSLYKEFQAERQEILRHQRDESEKAGHDIGFDQALTDWMIHRRPQWLKGRKTEQADCRNS
jgi:hypothetical protein